MSSAPPVNPYRALPATEALRRHPDLAPWVAELGPDLVLSWIRQALDAARAAIAQGHPSPTLEDLIAQVRQAIESHLLLRLREVINATGVVLHTNLGRAPLSRAARAALVQAAQGYTNLEYDLARGRRGHRGRGLAALLAAVTGAEDGLVVNNNAAAVMLILRGLAARRRVLIARTQLIEIGGGFRIPAILQQSGAKLVEVGTTNKVRLSDYEAALQQQPIALVLWVHRSNFRIVGFHEEPGLPALAALAQRHRVPLVADVGSGALLDTTRYGLPPEPTVQQALAAGADLVAFSGDKLLGGPQAGLIVGRRRWVQRLARHPLMRALRVDKLTLAALEATLQHYLRGEAEREVPVWAMLSARPEVLRARATAWQQATGLGTVQATQSAVGGGSLPAATLPSAAWVLTTAHPHRLARALRIRPTRPIVARVAQGRVWLDPRTVLPEHDAEVARAVAEAWPQGE